METWLVESYLDGRLPIPGTLMQWGINTYLDLYNRLAAAFEQGPVEKPVPGKSIAERSTELMRVHYDMPLNLFERMLGPSMKYSMALWERGARTLEEAQDAMLTDVCDKAGIGDGQRILDIGCGFGSLATHVLRRYPRATVCGLTLSRTQADYLRARQAEPGHPLSGDRFQLVQEDFNRVSFPGSFDRIVSLGVFEHVANLDLALEKVRGFLAPQGTCFLHYIVYREPLRRVRARPREDNFIDRYIFPGGRIWFEGELPFHDRHLRVDRQWYLSGANYRRTLQEWLRRLKAGRGLLQAQAGLTDRTLRLWELYLRASAGLFASGAGNFYGNGQYLMRPV